MDSVDSTHGKQQREDKMWRFVPPQAFCHLWQWESCKQFLLHTKLQTSRVTGPGPVALAQSPVTHAWLSLSKFVPDSARSQLSTIDIRPEVMCFS